MFRQTMKRRLRTIFSSPYARLIFWQKPRSSTKHVLPRSLPSRQRRKLPMRQKKSKLKLKQQRKQKEI